MQDSADAPSSKEEETEKTRLQKKGVHALQRQGLTEQASTIGGEATPVHAELELQRNSGDYTYHEVDGKNLHPKISRCGVALVVRDEAHRRQDGDEESQPHSEDREQVVKHHRECELHAVGNHCVGHVYRLRTTKQRGIASVTPDRLNHAGIGCPRVIASSLVLKPPRYSRLVKPSLGFSLP